VLVGGAPLLAPPALVLLEAPAQVRDHALELALVGVRSPVLLERELDLLAGRSLEQDRPRLRGQLAPRHVLVDLEARADRVQNRVEEAVVPALPRLDRAFFD